MKWKGRERSENVEDRRGMSPGKGLALGGGGIGMLLLALLAWAFGMNPQGLLDQAKKQQAVQQQAGGGAAVAADDEAREFISVVLRDTERVWSRLFKEQVQGGGYQEPALVIYSGNDRTDGCGPARSEFGPFYCPADQKIYIDPSFFDDLKHRHKADGDFAQAYVIAHEVAHHVQNLTGFSQQVDKVRSQGNELETNRMSVRLELQADYLAGVWAHHAHKEYAILEEGDLLEAITAANQIGDDTLMKEAGVKVVPQRFTHGTSKQRVYWFSQGIKSGELNGCEALFRMPYEEL